MYNLYKAKVVKNVSEFFMKFFGSLVLTVRYANPILGS